VTDERRLLSSSSPHVRSPESVPGIMGKVVLALLPVTIYAIYLFGIVGFKVIAACVLGAVFTEEVWRRLRSKDRVRRLLIDLSLLLILLVSMAFMPGYNEVLQWALLALLLASVAEDMMVRSVRGVYATDYSAIVTGLLLALCMPPRAPWWLAIVGSALAIGLGKEIFGGLGYNLFNPALVGRAILLMSWPVLMTTTWWAPLGIDAGTSATPLYLAKEHAIKSFSAYYEPLFIRNVGGSMGEVSAALLLIGGLYLLFSRVIDWRTPAAYLGSTVVMALLLHVDPVFSLLAGGIMLGAFFMATDYVTSCTTLTGKLIFGAGCGVITMLLRHFSGANEAVTGAILFMNMLAPLIDRSLRPRLFGEVQRP
jgi:Na+-translocating ferredoxin:NAD+ oxidoreductase subunit D